MKTLYQVGTRVVIQSLAAAPLARETVTTIPTITIIIIIIMIIMIIIVIIIIIGRL